MPDLESALKQKIAQISGQKDRLSYIKDWVGGYEGKIIQLLTRDKAYHVVFTKEAAQVREGEYPSCDITYYGDESTLLKIINGETSAKEEVRAGRLKIWQNLHEAFKFEGLLKGA